MLLDSRYPQQVFLHMQRDDGVLLRTLPLTLKAIILLPVERVLIPRVKRLSQVEDGLMQRVFIVLHPELSHTHQARPPLLRVLIPLHMEIGALLILENL